MACADVANAVVVRKAVAVVAIKIRIIYST
jgi:hypothetical protein